MATAVRRRAVWISTLVLIGATLLGAPVPVGAVWASPTAAGAALLKALQIGTTIPITSDSGAVCMRSSVARGRVPATASCDPSGRSGPAVAGSSAPNLRAISTIETPRYWFDMAPLPGGPRGTMVRVHAFGDVVAMDPSAQIVWTRNPLSLDRDWGIKPWTVPIVLLGSSPIDPAMYGDGYYPASERPYAVGDLNGDGVADVVVAHEIEDLESRTPFHIHRFGMVTVLDGRDGHTLWSARFPYLVTQVAVIGQTLIVADESGQPTKGTYFWGEDGTTSSLFAYTFARSGSRLTARRSWSYSTGAQYARWLSLEPAGNLVTAAWSAKQTGAPGTPAEIVAFNAATGGFAWIQASAGYPRMLRYDPGRAEVVAAEEADPGPRYGFGTYAYSLVARRLTDGATVLRVDRAGSAGTVPAPAGTTGSILTSFRLADVAGKGSVQWITGESETSGSAATSQSVVDGRIVVADGGTGATVWQAADTTSLPVYYGLTTGPGPHAQSVFALAQVAKGSLLTSFNGTTGKPDWTSAADQNFPLFISAYTLGSTHVVRVGAIEGIVRDYSAADGQRAQEAPFIGDTYASAVADVNHDGARDLVVGGLSGGVFALDGRRLSDKPGVLWRTDLGAPVHSLEVADLLGDGSQEVVAAATNAVYVLRSRDGAVLGSYAYPGYPADYISTFTIGDLRGDGRLEILVPSRTLAAYSLGPGGLTRMWVYDPAATATPVGGIPDYQAYFANAVVTRDHRVVSEFFAARDRENMIAVGLAGATGTQSWITPNLHDTIEPDLWRAVAIPPGAQGEPDGYPVAATYDQPGQTQTIGANPKIDVYGATTGKLLWSQGPLNGWYVHMGTTTLPTTGLVEFTWYGVVRAQAGSLVMTATGSTSDVAEARLASGPAFLSAWAGIDAYPPGEPATGEASPKPLSSWNGFEIGTMRVADLAGRGHDQVIGTLFDWPGYAAIAAIGGAGVSASSLDLHGIAVLDG